MLKFINCNLVKACGEVSSIRSYATYGNKKYLAKRNRKGVARNATTPMEGLHSLRRGEKDRDRYTNIFNERSTKFIPCSKLPAPRMIWDYDVTDENVDFLKSLNLKQNEQIIKDLSPLKNEDWPLLPWTPDSIRCGAVGVKLGVQTMWLKDGSHASCTLVQLLDCHVVRFMPKDVYSKKSAAAIVGCKNTNPFHKNENYAKFCHEAGIPIKTRCFRFKMTDNAALKPGTKLDVTHFRPGQFVDCTAKTVGYGTQGVMSRFHVRGGTSDKRGSQKSHRRIGSVANRSGRVPKGTKMPGQVGGNYKCIRGLQVLRMNTKHNVLYLKGRFSGHVNQFVKIQDSSLTKYLPKNDEQQQLFSGPFPKYIAGEEPLAEDIYHKSVFRFDQPSIEY